MRKFLLALSLSLALHLPLALSMFGAEKTLSKKEADRTLRKLKEKFSIDRAFYQPEQFCPEKWAAINAEIAGIDEEIRKVAGREPLPPHIAGRLDSLPANIAVAQSECRHVADSVVDALLRELRARVDWTRRIAPAQRFPERDSEALLAECQAMVQDSVLKRIRRKFPLQAIARLRTMIDRLSKLDPCAESFGAAESSRERGSIGNAIKYYENVLDLPCFDEKTKEHARIALGKLHTSTDSQADENPEQIDVQIKGIRAAERRVGISEQPAPSPAPMLTESPSGIQQHPRYLATSVWQSAWGDFAEIDELVDYLRKNHIFEVYLNLGIGMRADYQEEAYSRIKPLVLKLRQAGVRRICYLYAERNYPIAEYADFLKRYYSDLGIDTIVDDSEFTDASRAQFEENIRIVKDHGLRYSAYVTLESVGNSGVGDEARRWAIQSVDDPILMSYFSCSVEEQKQWLESYLTFADDQHRRVKIAILMGGKRAGREISCEQKLDEASFQRFLRDLHSWAAKHPSYAGIVLETNHRMPKYDVSHVPLN